MVLMRRIILRRISIAGGTKTMLKSDITGSCTAITAQSPMSEARSRPIEVMRRLSTWLAAVAPVVRRATNSERWRPAQEPRLCWRTLRNTTPPMARDAPVADAREDQRLAIGGHRLDHEDHGGHQSEDDDPRQVLVHIGLVDDVADQICAERGAP